MRTITGTRGSGKTVQIVKEANTLSQQGHNVVMLVATENHKEIFKNYGLSDKVKVVTYSKYKRDMIGNEVYKNADLFIDELDYLLPKILGNNVASVTMDKENMVEISRESWSK